MSLDLQQSPQKVELKYGQILDFTIFSNKTVQKGSALFRFASLTETQKTVQVAQDKSNLMGGSCIKWADGERVRLGSKSIPDDQPPRIYVNNIPKACDQNDIRELFEQYGQITDFQVINESAISQSAYITYTTKESCILAFSDQLIMGGQPITVRFVTGSLPTATPKTQRYDQDFNPLNNWDKQDVFGDTPLHSMARGTNHQRVRELMIQFQQGDINKCNSKGMYCPQKRSKRARNID